MTGLGDLADEVGVLAAAAEKVVVGHETVPRAGGTAVAVEAGPDEAAIGHVGTREQARDAFEERGLGQLPGRRQQAEHGPLEPVGQGRRRARDVLRIGQPPGSVLDLPEVPLRGSAHLVADEREQSLHDI